MHDFRHDSATTMSTVLSITQQLVNLCPLARPAPAVSSHGTLRKLGWDLPRLGVQMVQRQPHHHSAMTTSLLTGQAEVGVPFSHRRSLHERE